MIFEEDDSIDTGANLKVIGIGGCGGNAVQHMIDNRIEGVEFICANTDAQDLSKSTANVKIPLGLEETKGRGAGSKPEIGRKACLENKEQIKDILVGTEMLFLTAGMGGGTGTGASPVVAEVAKEKNILSVAVVTTPFSFEGSLRMKSALKGIEELSQYVDSIIVVPNEKLLTELGDDIKMDDAYKASDSVLRGAVQGIADLINTTGRMNVDFADVTTVMSESGQAMMGTGESVGNNRAEEAADAAVNSPLLNDISLENAKALLVNISASKDIALQEFAKASNRVKSMAAEDATIIIGNVIDETLGDKMKVTVIATGLSAYDTNLVAEKPKIVEVDENDTRYQAEASGSFNVAQPSEFVEDPMSTPTVENVQSVGIDYLDIPTFLRKNDN